MNKNEFLCPKCRGKLRIGQSIVLAAKDTDGERGLILLSPELGNYETQHHESFNVSEGVLVDFYCPLCNKKITSTQNKNLASLILREEDGEEYDIIFSQIRGEQCTYKVLGEHVEIFGKHAAEYLQLLHRV